MTVKLVGYNLNCSAKSDFTLKKVIANKSLSWLYILLLLSIFLPKAAHPQTADSLELISSTNLGNLLSTRFFKQLSTYDLHTRFEIAEVWDDFDIRITENFNSTVVRSSEKNIRDEQFFAMQNKYRLNNGLSMGLGFSSNIYSDNRKTEINQASTNRLYIYSGIVPTDRVYIAPFAGYLNDIQVLNDDRGPLYGAEAKVDKLFISDMLISSNFKFQNEDISPRKNIIRHLDVLLNSEFTSEISNFLSALYSKQRKDFYFEADSITAQEFSITDNIQSRIETRYQIQDRLQYNNLFNLFYLDIAGLVNWRQVERDTKYKTLENATSSIFDSEIDELILDFETIFGYNVRNFNGLLRLIYSERNEKNLAERIPSAPEDIYQDRAELEARKNNNSTRAAISFLGNMKLSQSDIIYFSIFHNKLRYDTPSEDNYDDRDELLSILRLRYSKQFTPFFEGFVTAEGTYNETVYIFSEKSSNNNTNRILKLAAGGAYKGNKLSSINSFEVSANYTEYEFQDLNPNIKSYSFRQFTAFDSTNFVINKKLRCSLYGYIKLSEQGDLNWDEFTSRPTRYLQEIYVEPRVTAAYSLIQFSAGIRFFSLSTYGYKSNNKYLDSEYKSIGPIAEILIAQSQNIYLKIYGWYEFITISQKSKKEQTNLDVEMTWNF
jgi:hypothetical protein